jgi:hypothetical protein
MIIRLLMAMDPLPLSNMVSDMGMDKAKAKGMVVDRTPSPLIPSIKRTQFDSTSPAHLLRLRSYRHW